MSRKIGLAATIVLFPALALVALGTAGPQSRGGSTATPSEMVATYRTLADAILAVKNTEANLVRSILGTTHAHAEVAISRALRAIEAGDSAAARSSAENAAAHVAQLGTEGDNAVAAVRKRLLEGGHHHNADGEKNGIFDPGFVIVTRNAKKAFLDASRAIGKISQSPDADALKSEWNKVEAAWAALRTTKH